MRFRGDQVLPSWDELMDDVIRRTVSAKPAVMPNHECAPPGIHGSKRAGSDRAASGDEMRGRESNGYSRAPSVASIPGTIRDERS